MNSIQLQSKTSTDAPRARGIDMKFEVVVIPVSDVERAKRFYSDLGWRLDLDAGKGEQYRVIQFTPPGSGCSIIFGKGVTLAAPGSAHGFYLIVSDIDAARAGLIARGIAVSEAFHDADALFHHADGSGRVSGPAPARRSYGTYASFSDPDGNNWVFQEVTTRFPGHVEATEATFSSSTELAGALRRAAAAHGEYEKRNGKQDGDWALWYAESIVREQA